MNRTRHVSSAICKDEEAALLKRLEEQIRTIRTFRSGRRAKPHKLVMLLSVIDMIERGSIVDGKVYFNRELLERFSFYFDLAKQPTDSCRPHIPFFHLRSLGWWRLQPKVGRENSFNEMKTCHSARQLVDNIECAYIAEDVYDLLLDRQARQAIRHAIAEALGLPQIANISCSQTEWKGARQG